MRDGLLHAGVHHAHITSVTYISYALCALCVAIFSIACLPETRGRRGAPCHPCLSELLGVPPPAPKFLNACVSACVFVCVGGLGCVHACVGGGLCGGLACYRGLLASNNLGVSAAMAGVCNFDFLHSVVELQHVYIYIPF